MLISLVLLRHHGLLNLIIDLGLEIDYVRSYIDQSVFRLYQSYNVVLPDSILLVLLSSALLGRVAMFKVRLFR